MMDKIGTIKKGGGMETIFNQARAATERKLNGRRGNLSTEEVRMETTIPLFSLWVKRCTYFFTLSLFCLGVFGLSMVYAADTNVEFGVEDDLTVLGTFGTNADPDVRVAGYATFGVAGGAAASNLNLAAGSGTGSVYIQKYLEVGQEAYFIGNIGIGTTAPVTALQVGLPSAGTGINYAGSASDLYVSGILEVDGNSYLGDNASVDNITITGSLTQNAPLVITSTTFPQLAVKYDGSNKLDLSVSSAGLITLTAVGSSAGFSFSNAVGTTGNLTVDGNTTLGNASGDSLTLNASIIALANASTMDLASSVTALNIESGLLNLDTSNSRIGIGTVAPGNLLALYGATPVMDIETSDSAIVDGDALGTFQFRGLDATETHLVGAMIKAEAAGTWDGTDVDVAPTELQFFTEDGTTADSLSVPRMIIDMAGNVGIGTVVPTAKFYVNGDAYVNGTFGTSGGLTFGGDVLPSASDTYSLGSATAEWQNLYIGNAGKIFLGLSQDVNLYRSAADVLKTDDSLVISGGSVTFGAATTIGDNSQTIVLDSSDWDISATGAMTGITDISNNGVYTQTGTSQNTFTGNIDAQNGLDVTVADFTVGGANFSVAQATGNVISAGDLAVNGGDIASSVALSIASSGGAITMTPNAGTNLNVSLSGAGDLVVNSNDLYVDTSTGNVGVGSTAPNATLAVKGGSTSGDYIMKIYSGSDVVAWAKKK